VPPGFSYRGSPPRASRAGRPGIVQRSALRRFRIRWIRGRNLASDLELEISVFRALNALDSCIKTVRILRCQYRLCAFSQAMRHKPPNQTRPRLAWECRPAPRCDPIKPEPSLWPSHTGKVGGHSVGEYGRHVAGKEDRSGHRDLRPGRWRWGGGGAQPEGPPRRMGAGAPGRRRLRMSRDIRFIFAHPWQGLEAAVSGDAGCRQRETAPLPCPRPPSHAACCMDWPGLESLSSLQMHHDTQHLVTEPAEYCGSLMMNMTCQRRVGRLHALRAVVMSVNRKSASHLACQRRTQRGVSWLSFSVSQAARASNSTRTVCRMQAKAPIRSVPVPGAATATSCRSVAVHTRFTHSWAAFWNRR
jgi:hypothetical protein